MTGRQVWRRLDSVALRFGLVLALALMPLGVMAMTQTRRLAAEVQARSESALANETLHAVAPHLAQINQARGAADVLAALDPATCADVLPRLARMPGMMVFAGLYDGTGRRLCGAGDSPALLPPPTTAMPTVQLARLDPQGAVLLALVPRVVGGGFAAVAARPRAIPAGSVADFALLVVDGAEGVVTALPAVLTRTRALPATVPSQSAAPDGTPLIAQTMAGAERAVAVVELIESQLYAIGSRPILVKAQGGIPVAPIWALSLLAAWSAAELLVTRHMRRLRAALLAFTGARGKPLDLRRAAPELRDTAQAFQHMAQTMRDDKTRLKEAQAQKDALLREVHHRVKNNLQLIASIVNLQLRRTRTDEARKTLTSLQDRMHGLATIHDRIYQTTDLTDVAVHQVFPGIVDQILLRAGARDQGLRVETSFDAHDLPLDKAVPLALLLTEAVTNAVRYVTGVDDADPVLRVSLLRGSGDVVVLDICNTASSPTAAAITGDHGPGIGTQLLRGFAAQLGGTYDRSFADGLYRVTIRLTLSATSHRE